MADSKISTYVKGALGHMIDQAGRDIVDAGIAGVGSGYLAAIGKIDHKIGNFSVPLDAVTGIALIAFGPKLPHDHQLPLHAMGVGTGLIGISTHRLSEKFFAAKKGAAAHGDFAPGFGADDPLLKAAAAL